MRNNQEEVVKNEKDLSMCQEKATGKRLNNQGKRKITDKMQRWKEMESNA